MSAVLSPVLDQNKLSGRSVVLNVVSVGMGVALIALLAQLSLRLPWSPVPITGQTFAVALLAFLLGPQRGVASVVSYLLLGLCGLPVFAGGLILGPTLGYLIGMIFAAAWIGALAERGWTTSFTKAWCAALSGSVFVFAFGLFGLSFFVPAHRLLSLGWIPFIPGDLIKTALAAELAVIMTRKAKS